MSNFHFDLLLRNATLLTAEPEAPIVRNASLGVIGDRIAWIGAELPAGARAAVDLDLSGRVVTPGFDGRCVVGNGRPTLVDMDAVLADARRTANELWRKAAA